MPCSEPGERGLVPVRPSPCTVRELLVRLVSDEGNDHAVQVEEEHDQVEAQLDERFLGKVNAGSCARTGRKSK